MCHKYGCPRAANAARVARSEPRAVQPGLPPAVQNPRISSESHMSCQRSARRAGILSIASIALAACSGSSSAQTAELPGPSIAAAHAASTIAVRDPPEYNAGANAVAQLPDFSGLVEKYGPAVVNVEVVEHSQSASPSASQGGDNGDSDRGNENGGDDPNDPFNQFFRRFGIPNVPRNLPP